mmetsp:Transcript_61185/g.154471  ORF Transcript_61185/g.154471 Transcript_61185/m.154471 type:complete len:336 (-) Transcript_61185:49-1056(-)
MVGGTATSAAANLASGTPPCTMSTSILASFSPGADVNSGAMSTSMSTKVSAKANSSCRPEGKVRKLSVGASAADSGLSWSRCKGFATDPELAAAGEPTTATEAADGGSEPGRSITVSAKASSTSSTQVLSTSPSSWESCKVSQSSSCSPSSGRSFPRKLVARTSVAAKRAASATSPAGVAPMPAGASASAHSNIATPALAAAATEGAVGAAPAGMWAAQEPTVVTATPAALEVAECEACDGPRPGGRNCDCTPGNTIAPSTNINPRWAILGSAARVLTTVSTSFETTKTSQLSTARCLATSSRKSPTLHPKGTHCTLVGATAIELPACHSAQSRR